MTSQPSKNPLRQRLLRVKEPTQTKWIRDSYTKNLTRLFEAFRNDVNKILGVRKMQVDPTVDVEELKRQIERAVEVEITLPAKKPVKEDVTRAYKAGAIKAKQFLAVVGINADLSTTPTDKQVLDILESRNLSGLKGITDEMSKQIMKVISDDVLNGVGPNQMARDINGRIDAIGLTRARVFARTESMYAFNTSLKEQYRRHGITEVEWLHGPEQEGSCEECLALDGNRYPIDEAPIQPLHPNCVCTYLSVVPD